MLFEDPVTCNYFYTLVLYFMKFVSLTGLIFTFNGLIFTFTGPIFSTGTLCSVFGSQRRYDFYALFLFINLHVCLYI